jgi:cytochrome c biogenesis protein CcmG/thiol:disulfide interchange protein DsbE
MNTAPTEEHAASEPHMDTTVSRGTSEQGKRWSARLRHLVPVAAFAALMLAFLWALDRNRDPSEVPSPLIGRQVPIFTLPAVKGRTLALSSEDLIGEVSFVNVFASWCVACRAEHPLLMRLKADGVLPIHGLNYKDEPDDAARWLNTMGDPYTRTGADRSGRVSIDWGVYGVPETFVVAKDGRIALKQIGPITEDALEETILPLVRRLQQQ